MATPSDHRTAERLAVLEEQARDMRAEIARSRERLHDLESDRATIRLVVGQIKELSERVHEIAEDAANLAVTKGFEQRQEIERRTRSLRVQYLGFGVTCGGLVVSLAYLFGH